MVLPFTDYRLGMVTWMFEAHNVDDTELRYDSVEREAAPIL